MKVSVTILGLLFLNWVAAQSTEPLVLKGKLTNCPENILRIAFYDEHHVATIDTLPLQRDGSFYFKTFHCTRPQPTSLQQKQTQINDIYVAPGYELTITGDATDYKTLYRTTRITGRGETPNRFRSLQRDWLIQQPADTPWYLLPLRSLAVYAATQRRTKDSIVHIAFNNTPGDDPYAGHFKKMILLNNAYLQLYYLLTGIADSKLGYSESRQFLASHIDTSLLTKMNDEENLVSNDFRAWVAISAYPKYLLRLDYMEDSTRRTSGYRLKKLASVYAGKVRDFVLYSQLSEDITFTKSLERLNQLKQLHDPYQAVIEDAYYRKSICERYTSKEEELLRTAVGKPAPGFELPNPNGTLYSLAQFAGKVVYIDLWASWCSPCREETPSLTKLHGKYRNDDRVAFISIAVSDARANWLQALKEDKPAWIQLWDKEDKVKQAYVANAIPQFIIIDKKGNIVNFQAPRPSSGKELEELLLAEMMR